MDIVIQSIGFKASNSLEEYAREKLGKLDHHNTKIISADVMLFKGPESDPDNCHCEIKLSVPGNDPFVKKKADTYEAAIVDAVETIEKVLQKNKDKVITGRHSVPEQ
jgi:putative sigma-54 modulation protein